MKALLKKILRLPFELINGIKVNNESLLWKYAYEVLSDEDKLRLSKKALFTLMSRRGPEKGFKIVTYLNALKFDTPLVNSFEINLVSNLPLYESQLGQDCIVDTIFEGKSEGVFVEVGVGDGKKISNTYFLEKHRNWTGVLCEPSLKFHDSIRRSRDAVLVTDAVYDTSGLEISFSEVIGNEELSTLSDHNVSDSHDRSEVRRYPVKTISFNDVYEKYLKAKTIDYLSIDTEGSELTILKAIDFSEIDISVISVEHNYDQGRLCAISELLERFAYVQLLPGVFEYDAIFVKWEIVQRFDK